VAGVNVRETNGCVTFDVRVAPRSSRDAILGEHDGALKVALTAPPVDREANTALVAFLAKALGVPKRAVTILRGETGRHKTLRVNGVSEHNVRALLDAVR
jgi:uncharacterized protein (TIGR00251 family)